MVHFNIQKKKNTQKLELVNLKYVSYAQPILLSSNDTLKREL